MSLGDIFTSKSKAEFTSQCKDYWEWELKVDWDMNKEWIKFYSVTIPLCGILIAGCVADIKSDESKQNNNVETVETKRIAQSAVSIAAKVECLNPNL